MKLDTLRGYGIAIGSVALVAALRLAVVPLVHNRLGSAFFLLAVILTARYGGFGPSWLALGLGACGSAYLQVSVAQSVDPGLLAGCTAVYLAIGAVLVFLSRPQQALAKTMVQVLPQALLENQQREKQALCYEIHDGMIQYATGALMLLEGYRRAHPSATDTEILAKASDGLRHAVEEGRRVIRGLQPTVLEELGVAAGLEELVEQVAARGLQVDLRNNARIDRLPKATETAIYRVVQEALTNASKHSGSDRAVVELERHNGDVCLEVRDFGRGFDVRASHGNSLGLVGMAERVRLLGGECSIESEPKVGTWIKAKIPVTKAES